MAYALKKEKTTLSVSPEAYIKQEKIAHTRSEYWDGQIVAMAGAKASHNRLATSLLFLIETHLRKQNPNPCEVFPSHQRVRIEVASVYCYPDLSVACDPIFDPDDCLLNPSILIEILSPSTEQIDRGIKWLRYQECVSLRAYLLVSPEEMLIEVYQRTNVSSPWVYYRHTKPDEVVLLDAIGASLPLTEIYHRLLTS
jgi:Uma2 family endonuclease